MRHAVQVVHVPLTVYRRTEVFEDLVKLGYVRSERWDGERNTKHAYKLVPDWFCRILELRFPSIVIMTTRQHRKGLIETSRLGCLVEVETKVPKASVF